MKDKIGYKLSMKKDDMRKGINEQSNLGIRSLLFAQRAGALVAIPFLQQCVF